MQLQDITEDDIEEIADSAAIMERGRRYYRTNRVKSIDTTDGKITAKVIGNSLYNVKIEIKGNTLAAECDCPYEGDGCKHIVAVLYTWLEKKGKPQNKGQWKINLGKLHFDLIKGKDKETLLRAFEIVDKTEIISLDKTKVIAKSEGKNVMIRLADSNAGNDLYFRSCSCQSNKDDCEHITAVFLKLIMRANPQEVPADYENVLRKETKDKKFYSLMKEMKDIFNEHKIEPLQKYIFFFSLTISDGKPYLALQKSQALKTGSQGKPTAVSEAIYNENKEQMSPKKQRLAELLILSMKQDPQSNYYSNHFQYTYRVSNPTLAKHLDDAFGQEILKAARELYIEEPEAFPGAIFLSDQGKLSLSLESKNDEYLFCVKARCSSQEIDLGQKNIHAVNKSGVSVWFVQNDAKLLFFEVLTPQPEKTQSLLKHADAIIKAGNIKDFIEHFYHPLSEIAPFSLPDAYEIKEKALPPKPRLFLRDHDFYFSIELRFLYGDKEVKYGNTSSLLYRDEHNELVKIQRDVEKEREYCHLLLDTAMEKDGLFFPENDPLEWLVDSHDLIAKGFEIYGQHELVNQNLSDREIELNIQVSSGIDWFDLKIDADAGGEEISWDKIMEALKNNERFIKLSDGSLAAIPKKWLNKVAGVIGMLEQGKKGLRAAKSQIGIVDALLDIAKTKKTDQAFDEIREKFKSFKGIKKVELPKALQGELRDYQVFGYHWLHFLKDFSFGGCLADEMGLGKTVQVLSLLLKEKEEGRTRNLVVVPTSLLFNWVDEVKKFTPALSIEVHHGLQRVKKGKDLKQLKKDIIITSYGTLRNDQELFSKIKFHYIILDESQQIKNPLAEVSKAVCTLRGKHRLAMTGTPIENSTLDLWSQFAFLNPGFLGSMNSFKDIFSRKMEKEKMESLKNMVNPFIMLRKKNMVAKELPEKQVTTLYAEMSSRQAEVYDSWKEKIKLEVKQAISEQGFMNSKMKILQGLMKLRQISNHPSLIDESYTGDSGKFAAVIERIEEVIKEGHKVLLFSSFVKMLKLFEEHFSAQGIGYCYLDGSTVKREDIVKEFQEDHQKSVFLISLKAGGVGLNLTAADYVFIVDPWWNPAAEMQAIDRAHRIGQENKVFVYKMIMKNSIEEKILELQESKLDVVQNVISSEENLFKKLGREEIEKMFE